MGMEGGQPIDPADWPTAPWPGDSSPSPSKRSLPPSSLDPRGGWLPSEALVDRRDPLPDPRRDRQVNIRLGWSDYSLLRQATDIYSVTPTTLARMLIKRGSQAIFSDFWLGIQHGTDSPAAEDPP
jgi:hypothetical protein